MKLPNSFLLALALLMMVLLPHDALAQRGGGGGFGGGGGNFGGRGQGNAQDLDVTGTNPTRVAMWRADLPGGVYEVALRSVISVSIHEYTVDGVARINELNIDTYGNLAVRFYYVEPITPTSPIGIGQSAVDKAAELAKEVASRATDANGDAPWEKVVKNYPTTTHAHTVEYRLDDENDLMTLFKSADQAFRMNQNTEIQLSGT